ncbi:unnamed protein product [Acanthoscelides obtectus]|uniref:Carboxylesterase type B domain-containing protein n=1 Tax=Acanthoscelides obtectus TaxID=200917 RepID=A0A9P0K9X9_ACAOB|nr:unnamed protein product [Acanthoscelides obtectus]CAK1660927.1 hypothetical protein AOBTE_LOCUS22339 [Acanthoscelides obtectus]
MALSETMMIYWSNFIRKGNPNESPDGDASHGGRSERSRFKNVEWTAYEGVHKKYLNLGEFHLYFIITIFCSGFLQFK